MDFSSCTPRSPSHTLEAPFQSPLIPTPPSPSTATAAPQVTLCDADSIDVSCVTHSQEGSQNSTLRKTLLINEVQKQKQKINEPSRTITTDKDPNDADGYSWRIYGSKGILDSKFTRVYYKCVIRGCPARKNVKSISENPLRYTIVYKGKHTCNSPIKTPNLKSETSTVDNFVVGEESSIFDPLQYLCEKDRLDLFKGLETDKEKKDCYSMFLLFPEDYEFQEDTLIQLWLARGCVRDEQNGHRILSSLFNGGYMIHSGTDHIYKNDRYKVNSEKMKKLLDLQHHNRNSYLKWENEFQSSDMTNPSQVQHASIITHHIDATVFQTLQQLTELKTLLFLHNYVNKVEEIPDILFQSLRKLQALDLSGTHIKKLSSSVGCLILLRYLDLSRTLIEWLPDTICSLVELQTLKLRGCSKLRGLPRQLKRLTNLRHLDVDVLRQLTTVPRGIGSLVNLQTLSGYLVGDEDGCKIQELKELNSITGDFCIAMLENVVNAEEAKEAALFMKENLNKLQLRWTYQDDNCYEVLECLQPCWNLRELQIFCYGGATFPNWVGNPKFTELVSVTLFKCEHVTELPLLEHLPLLKHLELVKMNSIKKIERRGDLEDAAFSGLERLQIDGMQSLETWKWVNANENDYMNLVELTISDCPELLEFCLLSCLTSIMHLEIKECTKLESISEIKLPDSLEYLIVEDCPMIKQKCLQQGGEEWYKIQHVSNIRICTNHEEDDDDGDSK